MENLVILSGTRRAREASRIMIFVMLVDVEDLLCDVLTFQSELVLLVTVSMVAKYRHCGCD